MEISLQTTAVTIPLPSHCRSTRPRTRRTELPPLLEATVKQRRGAETESMPNSPLLGNSSRSPRRNMKMQMDKAALLGHVVDHVKEQRERAKEATYKATAMPTEIDEVTIDQLKGHESTTSRNKESRCYMKASICCEDRPELFAELKCAIKGIGATIVEAEITSLGGRMKANFILCARQDESCCSTLKMALSRLVVSSGSSSYSTRSKRQRFFYPTPTPP